MADFLGVATRQAAVVRLWRARSSRRLTALAVARALVCYLLGGLALIAWTSHLGGPQSWQTWWDEPVVYQKLVCWTMLLELLGLAGSAVPPCGGLRPPFGSWLRPGAVRTRPWPRKPKFDDLDTRTYLDVALYAALVGALAAAVLLPGVSDEGLEVARPEAVGGLVGPGFLLLVVALTLLVGMRDKVAFMAARAELLLPPIILSVLLGFTDLVVALKLTVVVIWLATGLTRLGRGVAAAAAGRLRGVPVREAAGTALELAVPLTLLLATDQRVIVTCVAVMVAFHLVGAATARFAVPLELNLFCTFATVVLYLGYPAADGFAVTDFSQPWMLPYFLLALAALPVLGHLRPHLVAFLPALHSTAGVGPTTLWVMAPGVEQRLSQLRGSGPAGPEQEETDPVPAALRVPGVPGPDGARGVHKALAWRALQSQGRGLHAVLLREFGPAVGAYTVREAGPLCNALMGAPRHEAHLHDDALIGALQQRLAFEPGELTVIVAEPPSVQRRTQYYRVVDAALGVLRRGRWEVDAAVAEASGAAEPPVPLEVTWSLPGQPTRMRMRQS